MAVLTYKEARQVAGFVEGRNGKSSEKRARIVDKAVSKLVWSNRIYGGTVEETQGICKRTIFKLQNENNAFLQMPGMPPAELVLFAPLTPEKKKFIEGVEGVIIGQAKAASGKA
ncbi:MAG: hypothetical protein NTX79_04775 [Candidatus Micrarchaeota archaeon]|nr:hypothetical protein [Candidatus Micrarchaeota archaeon]